MPAWWGGRAAPENPTKTSSGPSRSVRGRDEKEAADLLGGVGALAPGGGVEDAVDGHLREQILRGGARSRPPPRLLTRTPAPSSHSTAAHASGKHALIRKCMIVPASTPAHRHNGQGVSLPQHAPLACTPSFSHHGLATLEVDQLGPLQRYSCLRSSPSNPAAAQDNSI